MLRRTHDRHRDVRTVEAAARTAGRNGNEPGERPMTRHGQVPASRPRHSSRGQRDAMRASLWRRPSGRAEVCRCRADDRLGRPSTNATSVDITRSASSERSRHRRTPAATRNPHSHRLWPAGSCMGGFRTPHGTRNPSPCRPLGQLCRFLKADIPGDRAGGCCCAMGGRSNYSFQAPVPRQKRI